MKIIGITGNSGSGKSTVCKILEMKYNIEIIDADRIARQLTEQRSAYLEDIVKLFGEDILEENTKLNRKRLAQIIYNDNKKREELNRITFIHVVDKIKTIIKDIKGVNLLVIDAPLLFESKLNEICDVIVGIVANENIKLDRICQRDRIDEQSASKRIDVQVNQDYIIEHSDYIIENNSTIEELMKKIEILYESFNNKL